MCHFAIEAITEIYHTFSLGDGHSDIRPRVCVETADNLTNAM